MLTRFLLPLLGCAALATPGAFADEYRLSGPYTHANLSIFLIHGASRRPGAKYLTLQEAMDQKKVVVYETGSVNELAIENLSSEDVYIQSGDIVKGGKQDRVFPDDFILQTKSGKVPISSFCVEHGRWTRRGGEASDHFDASNQALPMKSLKMAARDEHSQSQVWSEVAKAEMKFAASLGVRALASPSPTSMQLALENKKVSEATDAYLKDLAAVLDGKPDAIGFAFAINGTINSADMYPSNDMFRRMWPKLLRASAVEALTERRAAVAFPAPDIKDVRNFLRTAGVGTESTRGVASRVRVVRKDSGAAVLFETRDRASNSWIHRSYVAK
jgi:ARG/rhodanese/phosphatase superfamily protein